MNNNKRESREHLDSDILRCKADIQRARNLIESSQKTASKNADKPPEDYLETKSVPKENEPEPAAESADIKVQMPDIETTVPRQEDEHSQQQPKGPERIDLAEEIEKDLAALGIDDSEIETIALAGKAVEQALDNDDEAQAAEPEDVEASLQEIADELEEASGREEEAEVEIEEKTQEAMGRQSVENDIPKLDLTEHILSQERRAVSTRRVGPGANSVGRLRPPAGTIGRIITESRKQTAGARKIIETAPSSSPAICGILQNTALNTFQQEVITEIVARDIAELTGKRKNRKPAWQCYTGK